MKGIISLGICLLALLKISFAEEIQVSYEDKLKLELDGVKSREGLDIWLSKDQKATWVLVGKTFQPGGTFVYHAKSKGLHLFHFHPRSGEQDKFRPNKNTKANAKIKISELESENLNISYSNNRNLKIGYEVIDDTAGIYGEFKSWLYFTKNSGLTWNLYGADHDDKSPIEFLSGDDGLYGFKVVSSDIAGQKEIAPGPGVPPDVLVRIDTQAPKIQILSPQPFDLWESNTLRTIKWIAEDESMDRLKTVELYYSVGTYGDWKFLAKDLPSSGSYQWKIPESKNGRIFIEARAKDKSNNIGKSRRVKPFFTRNVLEELLSQETRDQANKYYETATICRKNRIYPKAVKYFRLCLQLNPYHVGAYNDLGLTFIHMNEMKEAFQAIESGLKYSPSNADLLFNLAKMYLDFRQLDLAEQVLKRMVHLYPKRPEGLWLSSELAFVSGKVELARKYWTRLIHLDFPDPSIGKKLQYEAKRQLAKTYVGRPDIANTGLIFNFGLE